MVSIMTAIDWIVAAVYVGMFALIAASVLTIERKKRAKAKKKSRLKLVKGGK